MNTSATDHDPKTALPPLANIISPSNSPTNLQQPSHYQAQQQQQQQMQPQQMQPQQMQHHLMMQNQNYSNFQQSSPNQNQSSMFYPPPITSNTSNLNDSNMLRFMNDYANQNNSSQLLSNFYPSINQLRSANTSHHSPSQYSMNSNTPLQMEMMESSNDILKHRQQSPLINQYYQNIQQQQQAQQLHQKLVSPSNSFGASMSMNTSGSNDLAITLDASTIPAKCMCKQPDVKRIPRPRNAFILFRQKHHQALIEEDNTVKTNPDVSRELGRRWRALSPADKDYWNKLAEEEKRLHAEKYPDYKYTPKRNGKKKCDYCIYKKQLKDQMNEKAAQRRIEKEQKRLEKHYQKQLLEQQKQQKQQQKQQQQQQQQSVATPSSTTSSSHQSQQQQQQQQQQLMHQPQPHHHHQINQLASASEYVSQYGTGNTFNDMNLSNYQRLTQQFKPPTPMTNPYYTSGYQQQPLANPAATSQLQHPQPQHIQQQQQPPQQQQQQQQQQNAPIMSSNSVQPNQYVKQEFQKNYLPYNNPQQSQDAQQTQQQQFNGSNSSIPIIESPNNLRVPQQKQQPSSMYNTNPSNPSRSGTPFDYSSYNQAPHQDNKHLVDGQEIKDHSQLNQAEAHPTVLPSINDLSLPPMNISQ